MKCSFPDCQNDAWAKGLCNGHLGQQNRGQDLTPLKKHGIVTACSFPGCRNDTSKGSQGLCGGHWFQKRHGKPLVPLRRFNEDIPWLKAHLDFDSDECLTWPFRTGPDGRGIVWFNGKSMGAHRAMCILKHGQPPTKSHQAAHECGKGHEGCVNPNHLAWKTPKENQADRYVHGTAMIGDKHFAARLNPEAVREIRRLGPTTRYRDLAEKYGVTHYAIYDVLRGKSWRHV